MCLRREKKEKKKKREKNKEKVQKREKKEEIVMKISIVIEKNSRRNGKNMDIFWKQKKIVINKSLKKKKTDCLFLNTQFILSLQITRYSLYFRTYYYSKYITKVHIHL